MLHLFQVYYKVIRFIYIYIYIHTYIYIFSSVAQSCPTLCSPRDYTVLGNLQARILEWVAFPSPEDLPKPGIKPGTPALQANSLLTEL